MEATVIIPYNEDRGYLHEAVASVPNGVRLIEQQGEGTFGQNFNAGLAKVETDYVCFLAEDDMLLGDFGARVAAMGSFDFVCANAELYDMDNDLPFDIPAIYKSSVPHSAKILAMHNSIHGGTVMYRTAALREVGGMDETIITGEEAELNMRLLSKGYKLGYYNAIVYRNRLWKGQKSGGGVWQPKDFADQKERKAYIARNKSKYL